MLKVIRAFYNMEFPQWMMYLLYWYVFAKVIALLSMEENWNLGIGWISLIALVLATAARYWTLGAYAGPPQDTEERNPDATHP